MRIVIALGGNALLRRGEPPTAENQHRNVQVAAAALAPIAREHALVIAHGNGPQVGLLALQASAYRPDQAYPLDILDAETEGMIGYLIERELHNALLDHRPCVPLLTQIAVDPQDPAFRNPGTPLGPTYSRAEARDLVRVRGWQMARDGHFFRRAVPSPRPRRILELSVIELLVTQGITVICAGGGGIPVSRRSDGTLRGVEAVIDKDLASALLARELAADAFLMLTDVQAVYRNWDEPDAAAIRDTTPGELRSLSFAPGSMAPKVEAACEFVETTGGTAGIGSLADAQLILSGQAGTRVMRGAECP